ncbi:MAG TPA: enoyl-CoA hydratase-related protein [Rhizomicrobium sp.]|nr:enoyl-CoA hydratase-related protein [Rhizomicrobium sp.]
MAAVNPVVDLARENGIAVVTLDSPPVNALSAVVREGLTEAFRRAVADTDANAIVLICAGRTFIAGADISELDGGGKLATIEELQALMERSLKPVVAAIHGTALGGGLEVALCAHYRIAETAAKCGLPEVKLGLLPGGGGTQRLPRAVGVERALEMITSGRHVAAKECLEIGLVDALAPDGKLRETALAFARKAVDAPLRRLRDVEVKVADPEIFARFRAAHADAFRGFEAPEANIRCIEASVLPLDKGLEVERTLFLGLLSGEQSAAQRHIFFAERQAGKVPEIEGVAPDDAGAMPEHKESGERLVEIARDENTSKEALAAALKRARSLGKLAVVTGPGFIGPRMIAAQRRAEAEGSDVLRAMAHEGRRMLEEKAALRASDIDVVMVHGYGWPTYRGGPMFAAARAGL